MRLDAALRVYTTILDHRVAALDFPPVSGFIQFIIPTDLRKKPRRPLNLGIRLFENVRRTTFSERAERYPGLAVIPNERPNQSQSLVHGEPAKWRPVR